MAPAQTYIVTGENTGLGFECASALAADSDALVIIACRDIAKAEAAAERIRAGRGNVRALPLDLASQESIRSLVNTFSGSPFPRLAGIVCNAGAQNIGAPTKTAEGYETTFAVNHLGHFLLTRLLLGDLTDGGHIIFVSSGTHDPARDTGMPEPHYTTARAVANDFEPGSNAGKRRYTTSKLCNLYCTYEYARRLAASSDRRLQSLRVNAFDPGLMPGTGLARTYSPAARFLWRYAMPALALFDKSVYRPKTSARRLARLVSGGEILVSGKYFSDGRETRSSNASYDVQKAQDPWDESSMMTGLPSALADVEWLHRG